VLESWLAEAQERWKRILGPGATLVREGEPLEGKARVDLKTLNLIADNLVDNARKFSRGSPKLLVVTRRLPPTRRWRRPRWHIEFRDDGWGFDPSDTRMLFSRFFRARTDAPYSIPGSGLGLYLAHTGSRALGLRLRAESEGRGRGARFTLEGAENGGGG
jgi:signal transduction histidine kinase